MSDELKKIKSKDAKLTALAHIDSGLGANDEMIAALKVTDKMTILRNASLKWYADLPLEKRPLLTALEIKVDMLEAQFTLISSDAETLGIDQDKFLRNRRDYFKLRMQLRGMVEEIAEKLGPTWSTDKDSPFLDGFLKK